MLALAFNTAKSVYFSRPVAVGSAVFCAIPALEYGFAALRCLDSLSSERAKTAGNRSEFRIKALKEETISRAVPTVLLAAAAFNPYPGTAAAGAIFFYQYAKKTWKKEMNHDRATICFSPLLVKAFSKKKKQIVKGCYQGIKWVAIKCCAAASAVFGWCAKGARAIGRGCAKVISYPVKAIKVTVKGIAQVTRPVTKAAIAIFKHPKAAAVAVVGAACVFAAVRYRKVSGAGISTLFKAATVTVGLAVQGALKGFQAAAYILKNSIGFALIAAKEVVGFTARAVTYIPSAAYHTVKFVVSIPVAIVRFAVR